MAEHLLYDFVWALSDIWSSYEATPYLCSWNRLLSVQANKCARDSMCMENIRPCFPSVKVNCSMRVYHVDVIARNGIQQQSLVHESHSTSHCDVASPIRRATLSVSDAVFRSSMALRMARMTCIPFRQALMEMAIPRLRLRCPLHHHLLDLQIHVKPLRIGTNIPSVLIDELRSRAQNPLCTRRLCPSRN
jgi:hypothetical protein